MSTSPSILLSINFTDEISSYLHARFNDMLEIHADNPDIEDQPTIPSPNMPMMLLHDCELAVAVLHRAYTNPSESDFSTDCYPGYMVQFS
jgi:hypothetical protein